MLRVGHTDPDTQQRTSSGGYIDTVFCVDYHIAELQFGVD